MLEFLQFCEEYNLDSSHLSATISYKYYQKGYKDAQT